MLFWRLRGVFVFVKEVIYCLRIRWILGFLLFFTDEFFFLLGYRVEGIYVLFIVGSGDRRFILDNEL